MIDATTPSPLSPLLAVTSSLARLKAWNDPALFLALRSEEELVAEARALEAAGPEGKPLYGRVFAVKDNIDVAGLPTTAACPAFAHQPAESAEAVRRLQAAGAIVLGKTNLDQFATGLVGVRSPYGVPRNALRADLIPGGSSSGSATAVGAGIVDFSLGTDTAGSGRVPAGMNGIVGLKPSLGWLSSTGLVPACRTLDTISVFARSVELAFEVACLAGGYDEADPYSRHLPAQHLQALAPGLTIGVPRRGQRLFFGDNEAEAAYERDLESLTGRGARIVEIDFEPLHEVARLLYEGPWVAERYAATKPLIEERPEAFHPVTRAIIEPGGALTAVAAFEAYYRLAELKRKTAPLIAAVDCLAVPTVPRLYTLADLQAEPIRYNSNLGSYTNFVNLLDLAAISVPVGRRGDGLPSSLTFIAPAGRDGFLASLALAVETGEDVAPTSGPGERIEIAVVGAHLSGLPLNRELTGAGGIFLRRVRTRPDYRFYALSGTVPPKPGLIRVTSGAGASIEAEIWGLDAAAFGRFVANIPAPLGIGTLNFDDSTSAKGFLCEAAALEGARDISDHGGWRAYLASLG